MEQTSFKQPERIGPCNTRSYAIRLRPGQDLKGELDKFVKENKISAGYIGTCAGSLTEVVIRFAGMKAPYTLKGKFEIVSLGGTVSSEGGSHIHISIADSEGKTIGGHLMEGCKVYTTAEIVIVMLDGVVFVREKDEDSGYNELKFKNK